MLDIDAAVKTLYKSHSVHKQYEIVMYTPGEMLLPANSLFPSNSLFPQPGGTVELLIKNDRLVGETLQITESICESGDIVFGECYSSMLTFECADVPEDINGREFYARQRIGDFAIPLGVFVVKSSPKQINRRFKKVTAYDRMVRFDVDVASWYKGLWTGGTTSMTLAQFRVSLCSYLGVPCESTTLVNDSMTVTQTIDPAELSGRDVLQAICEINGVFGRFNRYGILTFVSLGTTVVDEITTGLCKSPPAYEEYVVPAIDTLTIRQEENDIGANVGSGANAYIVQGNFLVYGKSSSALTSIATALLNKIGGITYRPMSITSVGLPYLEPGDHIQVTSAGDTYYTYVLKRVFSGAQALSDNITATGEIRRTEKFGRNKEIVQLEGRYALLERSVEGLVSTIGQVGVGLSTLEQTVEGFEFTVQSTIAGGQTQTTLSLKSGGVSFGSGTINAPTKSQVESLISAGINGIEISVTTPGDGYSYIKLTKDGTVISSSSLIELTGIVRFTDLQTPGMTTIKGGTIETSTLIGCTLMAVGTGSLRAELTSNGFYIHRNDISAPKISLTTNAAGSSIQLILGAGDLQGDDRLYIRKYTGGAEIVYHTPNGYARGFTFTESGIQVMGNWV